MLDQEVRKWQTVLQKIIQSPKERQRLASALGINVITLTRWAKENSNPQRSYLTRLVQVVQPQQRAELLIALLDAYPDMQEKLLAEASEVVPSAFFRQLLKDRASVVESMQFWQISTAVLDEALRLLDPHHLGLAVTPVLCMPPIEGKIRSLREHGGRGTFPWVSDLSHLSTFLGMNSLAGHVVQNGRAASVRDIEHEQIIPAFSYPENLEKSSAAAPIWLEGKIAGCLLASSAQLDYFTQSRMDLLDTLASIYSLALNPGDFYDLDQVHLRYMPHPDVQQIHLQSYRERVARLMTDADEAGQPLSCAQAEMCAWREIEDILLCIGQETKKSSLAEIGVTNPQANE
ncbi:MAG TPA: GAF domain-containing protein [Ktedonobacteraceae bacterium]|nr:GAF domain-containing protein [Ktedonobacteraceae bacterium]